MDWIVSVQSIPAVAASILIFRLGRDENDLTIRYAAQATWGYLAGIDHWAATESAEPLTTALQRTTDLMVEAVGAVLNPDRARDRRTPDRPGSASPIPPVETRPACPAPRR
ncbi:hypothetical protein ACFVAV_25425 [Nocardia sp. NPDC057663]|uniref:hypothetical protein n=1 Tax=Nocardia sp. NPDC057663 TaxID=3346201 RepID=UPI00366E7F4A